MKKLVLINNRGYNHYKDFIELDNSIYYIDKVFLKDINNIIRKVLNKFNLNRFGNWRKKLAEYDQIIIFDSAYSTRLIKKIKNNTKGKIILWFWNDITSIQEKILNDKKIDAFYTFNEEDSKNYKIKYNSQFYFDNIKNITLKSLTTDIYFMGLDKGRRSTIEALKKEFKKNKIKYDITIVDDYKNPYKVTYKDYLMNEMNSRCLLDINHNNKSKGLTLRPLEALVMQKKIITNNQNIINYDFYNKENIFIIGVDDINELRMFIKKPYKLIDKKMLNYYSFSEWINRFEA